MRILDLGEVREGLGCSSWMGHLMPESGKGDANGNWTYDNGSSGTAMLQCSYWGVMHTSLDLHLRLGRLLRPAQDLHLLLEVNVNVHKLGSIRHRQAMRYYV